MKIGNSSYSKIMGIGDVCIETNVEGCATCSRFKDERVSYIGYGLSGLL